MNYTGNVLDLPRFGEDEDGNELRDIDPADMVLDDRTEEWLDDVRQPDEELEEVTQ